MILDEGKSRVLLNPKISSLKLDDGESSFKWCEWVELVFNEDWWDGIFEVELNVDADLSLKMRDVEMNLESFRCSNFDSHVDLNEGSNDVRRCEFVISDANLLPSIAG